MAITIDYSDGITPEYVINVPKADMILVSSSPTEIRELNIDTFRKNLGALMDDELGMAFPVNHQHTAPLTIAGVTLARVVSILSPYVVELENGSYNVNITGGNSNISDVIIKNTVGVNTSNSAGLQDPFALQAGAFGGLVALDTSATTTGTEFPFGTRSFPVNNVADAIAICQSRGFRDIVVLSDMTFTSGDFSDGYSFTGGTTNTLVTLNAGTNITNCEFHDMTVTGTLDGNNSLFRCTVGDITFFNGTMRQCGLTGEVTLSSTNTASIIQCFSFVPGVGATQYPTINLGGTHETPLVVRDWQGGLGLVNCTSQTAATSIDLSSGRVVAESTISAGAFTIRGVGTVDDQSTGTASVVDATLNADVSRTRKHLTNRLETNPTGGTATLYDDDGTTALETSQMYEDVAGAQTYRGDGADRRDGYS